MGLGWRLDSLWYLWSHLQVPWRPRVINDGLGPLSYVIRMDSRLDWILHIDHLRTLETGLSEIGEQELRRGLILLPS